MLLFVLPVTRKGDTYIVMWSLCPSGKVDAKCLRSCSHKICRSFALFVLGFCHENITFALTLVNVKLFWQFWLVAVDNGQHVCCHQSLVTLCSQMSAQFPRKYLVSVLMLGLVQTHNLLIARLQLRA